MRKLFLLLTTLLVFSQASLVFADGFCSTKSMFGRWAFATDLGALVLPGDAVTQITAVGIFTVDEDGNMEGVFDATIGGVAFIPEVTWWGTLEVGPDCRGVGTFTTSLGDSRTDSFVLLSRSEALGMTRDPINPWTYTMRRLPGW
jgi:hypothetical protein